MAKVKFSNKNNNPNAVELERRFKNFKRLAGDKGKPYRTIGEQLLPDDILTAQIWSTQTKDVIQLARQIANHLNVHLLMLTNVSHPEGRGMHCYIQLIENLWYEFADQHGLDTKKAEAYQDNGKPLIRVEYIDASKFDDEQQFATELEKNRLRLHKRDESDETLDRVELEIIQL